MGEIDGYNVSVELLWSDEAQRDGNLSQIFPLFVGGLGDDRRFVVPDMTIERGHKHEVL